jgi:hypothetical protein
VGQLVDEDRAEEQDRRQMAIPTAAPVDKSLYKKEKRRYML